MTDVINLIFTILVVLVAVAAGLWFGTMLADNTRDEKGKPRRTLGAALRETTTSAVVKLWKWQRARGRESDNNKK